MPKYSHHQTNTSAASVAAHAAAGVPIVSPPVSVPSSSVHLQMALPGQVAMAHTPMSMAAAPQLAASPFQPHGHAHHHHHPGVSFGAGAPVITAAPMMMHARPQMIQVAQPHPGHQLMMAANPAAAMMSMRPQFANQGKPHWPYYR